VVHGAPTSDPGRPETGPDMPGSTYIGNSRSMQLQLPSSSAPSVLQYPPATTRISAISVST
jgi:hypothetical protein